MLLINRDFPIPGDPHIYNDPPFSLSKQEEMKSFIFYAAYCIPLIMYFGLRFSAQYRGWLLGRIKPLQDRSQRHFLHHGFFLLSSFWWGIHFSPRKKRMVIAARYHSAVLFFTLQRITNRISLFVTNKPTQKLACSESTLSFPLFRVFSCTQGIYVRYGSSCGHITTVSHTIHKEWRRVYLLRRQSR